MGASIAHWIHAIDIPQQVEAVVDRKIPPQLRSLAEHDADARHMFDPVVEWNQPVDLDAPAIGTQNPRKNFDRRRLARAVRSDEAEQFAAFQAERHALQRRDCSIAALHEAAQRTEDARIALRDAISLPQVLDQNLRHEAFPENSI